MVDRLRESWQDNLKRLGAMDTSARLLAASIAVIVLMGAFLVAQYAAKPAMTSIEVKPDQSLVAMQVIRDHGYEVEDQGNGMLRVPAAQRAAIVTYLEERSMSPVIGEEAPVASGGLVSDAERRDLQRAQRILRAERAIRMIDGVKNVTISVSGGERRSLLGGGPPPKVTVTVDLKSGTLDRSTARMIAHSARIDNEINLKDVVVIDTGGVAFENFGEDGHDGVGGAGYLAEVQRFERKAASRLGQVVRAAFPQAELAVNAQVLVAEIAEERVAFEKPSKGEQYLATDESSRPVDSKSSGNPGFRSNAGTSGIGAVALEGGVSATRNTSEQVNDLRFPGSRTHIQQEASHPVKISASVLLPRQGVEALLRRELGEDATIDAAQIASKADEVRATLQSTLEPLVDSSSIRDGTTGEVVVTVLPFADYISPEALTASVGGGGGGGGMLDVVTGTGGMQTLKNAGLVGLSLLSLAMMFMMVRRTGGGQTMPTADELAGVPPVLDDDEAEIVGEADEAAPALVGVELDDEELRRKQMLDQLNQLVSKEPAKVASLLRRWMRSEA